MPRTNYRIVIEGTGQHHEGSTLDADYIAQRLVRDLMTNGQQVDRAEFTPGGPNPAKGAFALHPSDSLGTPEPQVAVIVAMPPLDEPVDPVTDDNLAEG
jgi:hypothetical protein